MSWLESIGRVVINGLSQMGSATLLVWQTIKQLKMINLWHVFQ
ncbi:MAG: ABC transporter permease, partial [Veillonella parvula]